MTGGGRQRGGELLVTVAAAAAHAATRKWLWLLRVQVMRPTRLLRVMDLTLRSSSST